MNSISIPSLTFNWLNHCTLLIFLISQSNHMLLVPKRTSSIQFLRSNFAYSLPSSVVWWKSLQSVWAQIRPDKTKCWAWFGSKLFDTLMVFQKEFFFKKVDFEKKQQTTKTWKITQKAKSWLDLCKYTKYFPYFFQQTVNTSEDWWYYILWQGYHKNYYDRDVSTHITRMRQSR